VHQLFLGFNKVYDSINREVLYNTVNEFVIPMKLENETKIILMKTTADSC